MMDDSKGSELKSAYELALERLETDGIARPDQENARHIKLVTGKF